MRTENDQICLQVKRIDEKSRKWTYKPVNLDVRTKCKDCTESFAYVGVPASASFALQSNQKWSIHLRSVFSASCVLAATSFILFLSFVWQRSGNLPARIEHQTITIDGIERSYRIVIPDNNPSGTSRPLLVALHGALDTTDEMAAYTQLDRLAVE